MVDMCFSPSFPVVDETKWAWMGVVLAQVRTQVQYMFLVPYSDTLRHPLSATLSQLETGRN